jgi:DNA-binding CsgD family transcriptional regulator
MSRNDVFTAVVAESSPIIRAGISHCLGRLPGLQIRTVEVTVPDRLKEYAQSSEADMIIVNPLFGGAFDPTALRNIASSELKIIAIDTGSIDRSVRALYDETFSISDDLDTMASKVKHLVSDNTDIADNKEPLSQREKEIVALVVKGMTNKEIAERLFLSVHTVITHRRNIARKLEIHSATGLTIYAIVNRLVELSDVNL